MNKENKILLILFVAVLFDMTTTYIFLNGTGLREANLIVDFLNDIHPLMIFVYVPFIVSLWGLFMKACYKLKLKVESRTLVLFTALMFIMAGMRNIGYTIYELI